MKFADRITQLKPSATLAVTALAQELKAAGKDIISLSIGQPDFPTPKHICDAAKKAIDDGFTGYTAVPGIPELRDAVAGYFNSCYGIQATGDNTIISNGGKQCLYNIFQSLLNPGDHVLIPTPYWVSYPPMVELAGAKAITVKAQAEAGFKVTIASLEQNLTPKTCMIIFNSPSNPTGACYTQQEVDAIAAWVLKHKLILVSDEIYDQLTFDGIKPVSFASWWEKHPENFIIVNGTAKSFAMTGWRSGYILAHPDYIKAFSRLQGQSTSNICSITQKATLAALTGGLDDVITMRASFERRRNLAMDIVGTWKDVLCPRPNGAFYLFPDVHKLYNDKITDSTTMCNALLQEAGIAAVPGIAFGDDNCIRLSYAVNDTVLEQGLTRIGKFLFK